MKRWIRAKENVLADSSFDSWYDSLTYRDQGKVDDMADEMGLPLYDECSDAELSQLHDAFVSSSNSGYVKSSTQDYDADDNDDDDYEEYDPFHGHRYIITGGYNSVYEDDPKKAITKWYKMGEKDPMDTAILAKYRKDAVDLCKSATADLLTKLDKKYTCPYKLDFMIEAAAKQVERGCKTFYENDYGYGDQVHPFDAG